jgi:hypothetical protein
MRRKSTRPEEAPGGAKRGPKPEWLKLEGPWENAVQGALRKPKPPAPKKVKRKNRGGR